jgi:hypothetical protein
MRSSLARKGSHLRIDHQESLDVLPLTTRVTRLVRHPPSFLCHVEHGSQGFRVDFSTTALKPLRVPWRTGIFPGPAIFARIDARYLDTPGALQDGSSEYILVFKLRISTHNHCVPRHTFSPVTSLSSLAFSLPQMVHRCPTLVDTEHSEAAKHAPRGGGPTLDEGLG